jgi:hypothetical protein
MNTKELHLQLADSPAARALLARIDAAGLPHGKERSFKLAPGRLIAGRLLVGMSLSQVDAGAPLAIADALGLPASGRAQLLRALPQASGMLLATEEQGATVLHKVYLEFWDGVRMRVLDGDRRPQLLHLGIKWDAARAGYFEETRYVCQPLLGLRDVLRRMAAAYAPERPARTLELARRIVRQAAQRERAASLVYLEAAEAGNPRRSYDVNLYPSGLLVGDVASELREAAACMAVDLHGFERLLGDVAALPLGHISGGCSRNGDEFLSLYAELDAMPGGVSGE